jgi:hypothetical protein
LEYYNIIWKKDDNILKNKDIIKLTGSNITHLFNNELNLIKLKVLNSGTYKCFTSTNKLKYISAVKLKVNNSILNQKFQDNYDPLQPYIKRVILYFSLIALILVITECINNYFKNENIKTITKKQKKDCHDIQKFLRINLEEFEKQSNK